MQFIVRHCVRSIRASIARQVLVAMLSVACVVLILASIISYDRSTRSAERAVAAEMANTSASVAREISDWFASRQLLIELTAETLAASGRDVAPSDLARAALTKSFLVTYYGEQKPNGRFIPFPRRYPLPPGYDWRTRTWYEKAAASRTTISTAPYVDATNNLYVVTLACAVRTARGLAGVLGADLSMAEIIEPLRRVSLGERGYAFLVSSNGTVLVHPDATKIGLPLGRVLAGLKRPTAHMVETREGHTARLAVFAPIHGMVGAPWYVGIVVNTSDVYAEAVRERTMQALLIGAIVAFASVMLWILLRTLVLRPLHRMTAALNGIAGGDLTHRVSFAERSDEIGAMARALEVFRANGARVQELTEAEAARAARVVAERARIVTELQQSFGVVVQAASRGDLTTRVPEHFADAELNGLARSVNILMETVDQGLSEAGTVMSALAGKDLTRRVQGTYQGAFANLKASSNAVAVELEQVLLRLRRTSAQLKNANGELSLEAGDLGSRTDVQAVAVEATAAAIRQLASTVADNATSVESATAKADEVCVTARQSASAMTKATEAMDRVRASAETIAHIIHVIKSISAQTGFVALNASLEAARAGQHGAGFAVVATEMRTLASNASKASLEVRDLIQQTIAEVNFGYQSVQHVAQTLESIEVAVSANRMTVEAVSRSGQTQAGAVDELSRRVREIEAAMFGNREMVQKLLSTMHQSERRAFEVDAMIESFTVREAVAVG